MRNIDLTEDEITTIRAGQHTWGRWKYFPTHSPEATACGIVADQPTVGIEVEAGEYYDFELERCNTEAAIGTWIVHLSGKDWVNPIDLGNFMQMLLDLYEAEVFVLSCSRPESKRCSALWCLRSPESEGLCKRHSTIRANSR